MATYSLLENSNPLLALKLREVSSDLDRTELTDDLVETMRSLNGIGLSANQVGIMERGFVMY